MHLRRIEELANLYAGRCPVLLSFERSLIKLPARAGWHERDLRDSTWLVGKPKHAVERELRQRLQGVQWKYAALSLLKSLAADSHFLPVIASTWLDLCVSIKTRQSHIHPPIFALPLHFDSRRTCSGHGASPVCGGLEALARMFHSCKRFPHLFLLVEGETVGPLPGRRTTIAFGDSASPACAIDYVAHDLREARQIIWGAIPEASADAATLSACNGNAGK